MELRHEQALIQAAQQGDERAFDALYTASVDPIYRYIVQRVSDAETAKDLTAEVFLHVIEGLPGYEYRGLPFLAWVYRIAQARITDFYRGARQIVEQPLTEALDQCTADDLDTRLTLAEDRTHLQAATRRLTPEQQQVIFLRFSEGLDLPTTADVMGKTVGAVKQMQWRALRVLSKVIQGRNTIADQS